MEAVARTVEAGYHERYGRNGWDGRGTRLKVDLSNVPRLETIHSFQGLIASDAVTTHGGRSAPSFALDADIMAHEFAHMVINASGYVAWTRSTEMVDGKLVGATRVDPERSLVHESFADVLAASFDDNWQILDKSLGPSDPRTRNLAAPPYATYQQMRQADVDPHTGSITLSSAAVRVGARFGRETMGKIWFTAITDFLKPTSDVRDAARAVQQAADRLYGPRSPESTAVADAWLAVGLPTDAPERGSGPQPGSAE